MSSKSLHIAIGSAVVLLLAFVVLTDAQTTVEFSKDKEFPTDGSLATSGYEPTKMEKAYYDRLPEDDRWTTQNKPSENHEIKLEFNLHGHNGQFVSWTGIVRKINHETGRRGGTLLVENKYGSDLSDSHIQTVSINGGGDFKVKISDVPKDLIPLVLVRVYGFVTADERALPVIDAQYIRVWHWFQFNFMDYGEDHGNPEWKKNVRLGVGERIYHSGTFSELSLRYYRDRLGPTPEQDDLIRKFHEARLGRSLETERFGKKSKRADADVRQPQPLSKDSSTPSKTPHVFGAENAVPRVLALKIEHFSQENQNSPEIAYSAELHDGVLSYSRTWDAAKIKAKTRKKTPTRAEWTEFRVALEELNLWAWHTHYLPDQRPATIDSKWSTIVEYPDKRIETDGIDSYPGPNGTKVDVQREEPPTFVAYILAMRKLLGPSAFSASESRKIGSGYFLTIVDDRPDLIYVCASDASSCANAKEIGWRKPYIITDSSAIDTSSGAENPLSEEERKADVRVRDIQMHSAKAAWDLLSEEKPVW